MWIRHRTEGLAWWLLYGRFAVDLFIVLSGYCLMLPVIRDGFLKGGALGFYANRFWRIMPTYYAAIAFAAILGMTIISEPTGTHWDGSIPIGWRNMLACALMLQPIYESPKINHVFWSVGIEWWIYMLFPALVFAWGGVGKVARPLATTAIVTGAAVAIQPRLGEAGPFHFDGLFVQLLALFCFGASAATISRGEDPWTTRLRDQLPWGFVGGMLAGIVAVYAFRKGIGSLVYRWLPFDLAIGASCSAGLICLAKPSWSVPAGFLW